MELEGLGDEDEEEGVLLDRPELGLRLQDADEAFESVLNDDDD